MDAETRRTVWERARLSCEYCRRPQIDSGVVEFHIEHVYAKKHGGSDDLQNLCLSCPACNWAKGTNLSGLLDGKIVPLFHPRRQIWARHFQWDGLALVGRTLCGKVTIQVLNINDTRRLRMRQALIDEGRFPPED
jgi:hypothetical protein